MEAALLEEGGVPFLDAAALLLLAGLAPVQVFENLEKLPGVS